MPRKKFREDRISFKEAYLTPEKAKKDGNALECRHWMGSKRGSTQPVRS
jgi:hypothetical protein